MDADTIPIFFIPKIKYKAAYGHTIKIRSQIFRDMAALSWQTGDDWTSAWTVSLPENKIIEYQYVDSEYKADKVFRTDVIRTLNLETLPIDRTKIKSTICVLTVEDLWEYPEKSKITFTQVPIKEEKGCIVLGKFLNPDGSAPPEVVSRMEKLAKIVKSEPKLYKIAILTGSKVKQNVNYEAEVMYELGVKLGIDPQSMYREIEAKTTVENAIFSKILACQMGIVNFDVITSNYHLRRSEEIFKTVFASPVFKFTMIDDELILPNDLILKNEAKENYLFNELKKLFVYCGFSK